MNAKGAREKTKDAKESYNVLRLVAHQRRNDWPKDADERYSVLCVVAHQRRSDWQGRSLPEWPP
jgi:hypothetical protein